MLSQMTIKELLMLFFPGYISIELFRFLKKRPTFDDINVKNGIGREILISIFYSAALKYCVSYFCFRILGMGVSENRIIIMTFGLAILLTLFVFALSKVKFLMRLFTDFFGISPSYTIWNTLLEHQAYIEYETTRRGQDVIICGYVKYFETDKDGKCHVVLKNYSIRDYVNHKNIELADDVNNDYYVVFHSKDIKNLVIRKKKEFDSKDQKNGKKLKAVMQRDKNINKRIKKADNWIDRKPKCLLIHQLLSIPLKFYKCILQKLQKHYEVKISRIKPSKWFINYRYKEMLKEAESFCRNNNLSLNKLWALRYKLNENTVVFTANPNDDIIKQKPILIIKDTDGKITIEKTEYTGEDLG